MEQPTLGLKITELRNAEGITQKELAEQCKVDIRTIQRIESGEVVPRMYTLNLLSQALSYDFNIQPTTVPNTPRLLLKVLKLAFMAGLIYSANAIPVVISLTKQQFNHSTQGLLFLIHSLSATAFFYGFYSLGQHRQNQILSISSLLIIILLPLTNLLYFISPFNVGLIYILLCISCIMFGVGILKSANKSNYKLLYTFTGTIDILLSCLFLSNIFRVQTAGLIISIGNDFLLAAILYLEYQSRKQKATITNEAIWT